MLRVLENGNGLLRVIPEDVDIDTESRADVPIVRMNKLGQRHLLYDTVPGKPNLRSAEHILLYKPGRSTTRLRPPRRSNPQGNLSAL